ncbi:MAG: alpha/beta hydrolase [Ruminococcaceae bacterium]|nr:alpha/beta hydrolase [Oscillospiraceae bacterium]
MRLYRHNSTSWGRFFTGIVGLSNMTVEDRYLFAKRYGSICDLARDKSVRTDKVAIGSLRCYWFTPAGSPIDRAVLYLHGGAYIGGDETISYTASRLASALGMRVLAVDYRLAPKDPFPAAQHDALAAYYWLRSQGALEDNITIVGDSAGGGLALSLAMLLRDNGEQLPSSLVLFSPWTDLTCSGLSYGFARDPALRRNALKFAAKKYAGGRKLDEPYISPLFGDAQGLPPTLIFAGTRELLLSDSVELARNLNRENVSGEIHIYNGMFHDFPLIMYFLPETRSTMKIAKKFICDHMTVRNEM